MGRLLLVDEVAAHLRITAANVRALISAGQLPAIVIPPDLVRIAPQHLRRFERARTYPFAGGAVALISEGPL